MDCREMRERLSDFRDGTLPAPVFEEISRHLAECPECSEVDRSLREVRDRLRELPPVAAPPELLARVRDAIAREKSGEIHAKSAFSRWKTPLEAAAAVLLLASAYWYWSGPVSTPISTAIPKMPAAPVEIASPVTSPEVPPAPVRVARATPRPVRPAARLASAPSAPAREEVKPETGERSIATLPEGTPDPKVRVWSLSDLPKAPVLRASTNFGRIVPVSPPEAPAPESRQTASVDVASSSSRLRPIPYGREVSMNVAQEEREAAGERIGETARRLGGTVEGTDRVFPDGIVAVRVVLPERSASVFIEELGRIGKIPPEGMPGRSVLPKGPAEGTIAYTVRLRAQ